MRLFGWPIESRDTIIMHVTSPRWRQYWIVLPGLLAIVSLTQAQTAAPRAAQTGDALVRQVRTALGHGNVEEAGRLAASAAASPSHELATALVEIYRGEDTAAKARLQALYDKGTRG